jgi:hypothetical protein
VHGQSSQQLVLPAAVHTLPKRFPAQPEEPVGHLIAWQLPLLARVLAQLLACLPACLPVLCCPLSLHSNLPDRPAADQCPAESLSPHSHQIWQLLATGLPQLLPAPRSSTGCQYNGQGQCGTAGQLEADWLQGRQCFIWSKTRVRAGTEPQCARSRHRFSSLLLSQPSL